MRRLIIVSIVFLVFVGVLVAVSFLVPVQEVVITPRQHIPPMIQMVFDPVSPYGDHYYFETDPNRVQVNWHDVEEKKAYFQCDTAPCSGYLPLEGFNFPTTIDADGTVHIWLPLVWRVLS